MKKNVILILGALIILCLSGCGGQKDLSVAQDEGSTAKKVASSGTEDEASDAVKAADPGTEDEASDAVKADDTGAAENAGSSGTEDAMVDAATPVDTGAADDLITEDQAVDAITDYCYEQNPDLKDIVEAGEYPVYWDISSSDDKEIVVVFRSYTGALTYYHIDPATGDTYVTELVPGIIDEEQRTDETLNVRDYIK